MAIPGQSWNEGRFVSMERAQIHGWKDKALATRRTKLKNMLRDLDRKLRPLEERYYRLYAYRQRLLRCISEAGNELANRERQRELEREQLEEQQADG